jgi:anti-anti-sigma factor
MSWSGFPFLSRSPPPSQLLAFIPAFRYDHGGRFPQDSFHRALPMSVTSYTKDGILTVCLTDSRLTDEAKLEQLGSDLIKQLNDTTEERVILDFRSVQFMSSSMLGKLVQLQKKCKEFKVHLKLAAISPDIRQVFKITKLDKLFEIESDEAAARKAFMRRGWFG